MRKSWLIAAVVGGAAGAAQAADVQLFGIHTPSRTGGSGQWGVYALITNDDSSIAGQDVAGISSIAVDVLANGGAVVTAARNRLPEGETNAPGPQGSKYGFWLFRSDGTLAGGSATDIQAGQFSEFAPGDAAIYNPKVLLGVGLRPGIQTQTGQFTTEQHWARPVLVASGSYTGAPGNTNTGLTIRQPAGTGVNVLLDSDPSPTGIAWSGPGNTDPAGATVTVVDAKTFTTGTLTAGTTTTKAGAGDANLDGQVAFADLVALAQNYNQKSRSWFQGDFDLDNEVTFNDLVLLAQNYNQPVPASGTFGASFEGDLAAAFAQVPEPSAVAALGVAGMGLLGRRRRK